METRNFSAIIRFVGNRHAHATPPRRDDRSVAIINAATDRHNRFQFVPFLALDLTKAK